MTDLVQYVIGAGGGASIVAGILLTVRAAIRARAHRERNRAQVAVANAEHDAILAPKLLERISKLEERSEDCDRKLEATRDEAAAQRKADREACEEEIARVEQALARVAVRVQEQRRAQARSGKGYHASRHPRVGEDHDEDTGVTELEEIARRSGDYKRPKR